MFFKRNPVLKNNVEEVIQKGLCTGCGTCEGICPQNAIKMIINQSEGIYLPQLNQAQCDNCGICLNICPGKQVNFSQLNLHLFNKDANDTLLGNYIDCFVGHANDYEIRYNSASGGLVTALLIFALEEGIIDGVLVTKMSESSPLEPYPFIARTREEIISAVCSKYCPVAANIALKEVIKSDGQYAVVGLPCHIHGIRKALMKNKKLSQKIVLTIGLFCSHADTFHGTKFVLSKLKININDLKELKYRGNGWPGKMQIKLKNGHEYEYEYYMNILHAYNFFTLKRCFLCCDLTSEMADISCGDAWLSEYKFDNVGKSMIIVRTKQGNDLIIKALSKGIIELNSISREKVIEAQGITFKKVFSKKKALINTGAKLLQPNTRDYLRNIDQFMAQLLGKTSNMLLLKTYVWIIATIGKFLTKIKL